MGAKFGREQEESLFYRVTDLMISAGYAEVSRTSDSNAKCDVLAYGRKLDGSFGVVAVVEMKTNADQETRDRVAPTVLLAKMQYEADFAFLVSPDEIWIANEASLAFDRAVVIPGISREPSVVRSTKIALHLIRNHLEKSRGVVGLDAGLESLVTNLNIKQGLVCLPDSDVQIEGRVFLEAVVKVLTRLAKVNRFGAHASSTSANRLFSILSSWFPNADNLFDPAAGVGMSLVKVAQGISDRLSASSTVTLQGFDISPDAVEIARVLGSLNGINVQATFNRADLAASPWPLCHLLICEPPLGLQLESRYRAENFNIRTLEEYVVLKAAQGIINGKIRDGAILLTTRGWLTRDASKGLRDFLAKSGLVRALIGVEALNPQTSISLVAVVLGHGGTESVIADLTGDWESHLLGEVGDLHSLFRKSFSL
jgi:hypothetical protein